MWLPKRKINVLLRSIDYRKYNNNYGGEKRARGWFLQRFGLPWFRSIPLCTPPIPTTSSYSSSFAFSTGTAHVPSTVIPDPLLSTSRTVIYDSPRPQIVLTGARLFFLQSIVAGIFSATSIYKNILQKFGPKGTTNGSTGTASLSLPVPTTTPEPSSLLNTPTPSSFGIPSPSSSFLTYLQLVDPVHLHSALGIIFAIYALFSHTIAYAILDRTVIRMEVEHFMDPTVLTTSTTTKSTENHQSQTNNNSSSSTPTTVSHANMVGQSEHDQIYITRPTLFGGITRTVHSRRDIRGAPATAVITTFRLRKPFFFQRNKSAVPGIGREINQYIFPVQPGWKSDNIQYLRTLIYGEYFRTDEVPPVPDKKLIAIEGYGAYRPAQFADPHHYRAQQQLETILTKQPLELTGTTNTVIPSATTTTTNNNESGSMTKSSTSPLPVSNNSSLNIQDGTVWTQFQVPPRITLQQKRKIERDEKILNKESDEVKHAKIGVPTNIGIDGKQLFSTESEENSSSTNALK